MALWLLLRWLQSKLLQLLRLQVEVARSFLHLLLEWAENCLPEEQAIHAGHAIAACDTTCSG